MPKKKEPPVVVNDQSFFFCRTCDYEIIYSDSLWREAQRSRWQGNWICKDKVSGWVDGELPGVMPTDADVVLLPGYKNFFHDPQEVDPIAGLAYIISDL